jgi:16S rRNA C967 or C1407 C5-methylase (RsmB/RsmF family)
LQLPLTLIKSLQAITGFDEEKFIATHQNPILTTSIRINPSKISKEKLDLPIGEKIPWTQNGFYLSERPKFTLDPFLHAGCYYVQEASSMFLEQALAQSIDLTKPLKVLDLCGAPGGKSTHILSLLNKESFLISNEVIGTRNAILQENTTKWGNENLVITQNDAKDFAKLESFFDVIVLDAPCSGSGLFRRDANAIKEWSENNVTLCNQRQQRIIADVLPSLKNGGTLIYSTCSYSTLENEDIMDWLGQVMEMENTKLQIKNDWNIDVTITAKGNEGYRFWPHKVKGEGFFICCFTKTSGETEFNFPKKIKNVVSIKETEKEIVKKWMNPNTSLAFYLHHNSILAIPNSIFNYLAILQNNLYLKSVGINVGSLIKKQLIPEHAFAISNLISNDFESVNLNLEQALVYLKKEEFVLEDALKGWLLFK